MTGAGFGGCAIALVHKDHVENFIQNIGQGYKEVVGYEGAFFGCSSGDGVREIKQDKDKLSNKKRTVLEASFIKTPLGQSFLD